MPIVSCCVCLAARYCFIHCSPWFPNPEKYRTGLLARVVTMEVRRLVCLDDTILLSYYPDHRHPTLFLHSLRTAHHLLRHQSPSVTCFWGTSGFFSEDGSAKPYSVFSSSRSVILGTKKEIRKPRPANAMDTCHTILRLST